MIDLKELSRKVHSAGVAARAAAICQVDDGGTANLDSVVLCGLKRVRESSMRKAGIACRKHWSRPGCFVLPDGGYGQGARRTAAVEAMAKSLIENGVDCFIHYQMD